MAYNGKNILLRMIAIQEIVLEHKKRGVSQRWIFKNIISPQYNISYSTFNRYLTYPAKRELKALSAQIEADKKQSTLRL